jgi:probable H4MPT-linked C1 transfer pathway protein
MPQAVLGLDVGGANLKTAWHPAAADGPPAVSRPFALWRDPGGLANQLRAVVGAFPRPDCLAVTMTGELCDCYAGKREGVGAILDAVEAAAAAVPVRVWTTVGRFTDMAAARERPLAVASANWLALAAFAGRYAPGGPALLIDVGSTTTDLVPLHDGRPVPRGCTDYQRLRTGELVYTGVRRTPVCALVQEGVAAELFATTLDVYLMLGLLDEDEVDRNTADGGPATRAAAQLRLARMIGADLETSRPARRLALARRAAARQRDVVGRALVRVGKRMGERPRVVILAGEGEFLARRVLRRCGGPGGWRTVSLTRRLGAEVSKAACAHAVAVLAAEEHGWQR